MRWTTPSLSEARTPASRILELVRRRGRVKREELARRTGLSAATVARAVSSLIDAGLLRYGLDSPSERGVGRPGTPLQVDDRRFAVIGIHLGRRTTTVALGDLNGRVLDSRLRLRREGGLGAVGELVTDLLSEAPDRQPLAAGLVAPWRELGWDAGAVAERAHDLLGLDIATAEHITAMATAEFLSGGVTGAGSSVFVYARETAGFVVLDHGGERAVPSRETSLNHFPTGSGARCECGRTGCFIATVGDSALAREAYARGWVAEPRINLLLLSAQNGHTGSRGLLAERARVLSDVVRHVTDMTQPDDVVIAGQPFTADPEVLRRTRAHVPLPVCATRFGTTIQASAACGVALRPVDADPLALAPRRIPAAC